MREEIEARIRHPDVRVACDVLLRGMGGLPEFETRYHTRGSKKAVHFVIGRFAPYAFIANAEWLLWYFRKPGVTAGLFTYDAVHATFPKVGFSARKEPAHREGILKITDEREALAVIEFVERHRFR